MILAEKIAMLRKQNTWSQEELAEKLGISRQSVSKWESGLSMPDLDKIIKMSTLFGVTTDYLLKDEMEEIAMTDSVEVYEKEEDARFVSMDEANEFMSLTKRASTWIALGVSLCVISPVFLLLLGVMADGTVNGKDVFVTENMAGGLGVAILLIIVAIGVTLLIFNGMGLSKYEYLEKEKLSLQFGVQGLVEKKKEDYEPVYRMNTVAGVVLCIVGVVPLMLAAGVAAGEFVMVVCVDIILILVAVAVNMFVRTGMIYGSYQKLLQEGDYTVEKKEIGKRTSPLAGAYWCAVTAIYLAISFRNDSWDTSWVIWPVAGVLFAAVMGVVNAVVKRKGVEV